MAKKKKSSRRRNTETPFYEVRIVNPGTRQVRIPVRASNPGLDYGDDWVQFILDSHAESSGFRDADITPKLQGAVERYESQLVKVLERWIKLHPPKSGMGFGDVWNADAPYNVLMTLRGEGVGIWDGRWDAFYSEAEIRELQKYLNKELAKVADNTGGGWLNEAFDSAVYETREKNPAPAKRSSRKPAAKNPDVSSQWQREAAARLARG